MRWMKHMTDAADDEKLADVLTEFGPEGYGIWWLLVEVVGKQMDSTDRCEASYSIEHWARKLYISKRKTASFLKVFSEKKLVSLEYDNDNPIGKILVKIPNMLKFRDEYSKKSGQCQDKNPDNVRSKKQIQKQKEIQKENKQLQVSEVRSLYMKYAGLNQIGNGQAVVFGEIAEKYTKDTITEAFQSAAANNIKPMHFISWCIKRMERVNEPPPPRKREVCL